MPAIESQFVGSIVGLAVGDAMGYPAEFRRRAQFLRRSARKESPISSHSKILVFRGRYLLDRPSTGNVHRRHPDDNCRWRIAVDAGQSDLDQLMAEMGRRFVSWSRSAKNNRSPVEPAWKAAPILLAESIGVMQALRNRRGVAAPMRVAPIGLYYKDLDQVADVRARRAFLLMDIPRLWKPRPRRRIMVAMALTGAEPEHIYSEIDERCCESSPDFTAVWRKVQSF